MKNKKIESIRKNQEFQKIYSKGKVLSSKFYVLKYLPNKKFRLGLSVSKKHFKTAIARNKIKRQLRSIVSSIDSLINVDLFVIVKPTYKTNEFNLMKSNLTELYSKIKCHKNQH